MPTSYIKLSGNKYSNVIDLKIKPSASATAVQVKNLNMYRESTDNYYGLWSRCVAFDTNQSGDIPKIGFGTKILEDDHTRMIYDRARFAHPSYSSKIYIPYLQTYYNTDGDPKKETWTDQWGYTGYVTYVYPVWYLPTACESDPRNRIKESINGGQIRKDSDRVYTINGMQCYAYTKLLTNRASTWTGKYYPNRGYYLEYISGQSAGNPRTQFTKSFIYSNPDDNDSQNNHIFFYNFQSQNYKDGYRNGWEICDNTGLYYYPVTISGSWSGSTGTIMVDYINNMGVRVNTTYDWHTTLPVTIKVLAGSKVYAHYTPRYGSFENAWSYGQLNVTNNGTENKTILCAYNDQDAALNSYHPESHSFHVMNQNCTITFSLVEQKIDRSFDLYKNSMASGTWYTLHSAIDESYHLVDVSQAKTWNSSTSTPSISGAYTLAYRYNYSRYIWWASSECTLCYKSFLTPSQGYHEGAFDYSNNVGSSQYRLRLYRSTDGFITRIDARHNYGSTINIRGQVYLW